MTTSLDDVSALARALVARDKDVVEAEGALKLAKERARMIREETIPAVMQELGITTLELDTGEKVKVKQDVYAAIPADSRVRAMDWLEEHDYGGLIKTTVQVTFGKGEDKKAAKLQLQLEKRKLDVSFDRGVHAQTLKAWLREQMRAGTSVPMDLFGARPVWVAKITKR